MQGRTASTFRTSQISKHIEMEYFKHFCLFTVGIQQSNQSKLIQKQCINLIHVKHENNVFKIHTFHVTYRFRVNF